ncbi:MAG: preprotein translocase subunit SecE [Micromonosporaceae bacterium]|nr:preprotein translocase subunit SecE [Micromonosporaceae bacterium]
MARKKRRDDDDAVDERLDQEADETLDEAAEDEEALDDDDLVDVDDDRESEDEDDDRPARRGAAGVRRAEAGAETKTRPAKSRPGKEKEKAEKEKAPRRGGPIAFLIRFVREVVAELRKVIWPTRNELVTYTIVVVIFVVAMLGIIALLDYGFAKGLLFVFGANTAEE